MLTPILGYSDMSMSRIEKDNPIYSYMEQISTAAHRAKDLVQQILTFTRQIEKERKPLKLHLIVKEALKLLRQSLPSTIEIKEKINPKCKEILADPTQMHQVVLNLCVNASHAMEEKGGILTIELSQVDIDAKSVKYYTNLKEQTYIRLIVSDTRVGMDEAIIERIFESFFTTKDVNKGTGMGLSTVHGIARGHSGDISVYSEKGKGSSFHVLLPAIKDEKKSEAEEEKSLIGGNETGLIIDDEEMIANMLKEMLEELGYSITIKNNSMNALKEFIQYSDKYNFVVTDLTMPKLTGIDLVKEFRKINSELPVVLITGYGEKIPGDVYKHYGINEVVAKPIVLVQIAEAIRRAIDK